VRSLERVSTRLIYLLLFVAPQVLVYLYLRARLPDPSRPRRARSVRVALALVFGLFNLPWVFVAQRALFGSMWSIGRLPLTGTWSAYRLPQLTRRTLSFPDLPAGLDGLTLLHLSDLHAGVHLGEDKMREIVAQANALRPDVIVQTGDMIDISPSFIPAYVRAFRELRPPLGVVTVLGNHDRYTGEREVIRGCRDAGQVFVQNGCHVIERG